MTWLDFVFLSAVVIMLGLFLVAVVGSYMKGD